MSYSPRTFIVGPDDTLYRLASAKFSHMLDDPDRHRLLRFAGQRVRMVEAIVELRERTPSRVVRLVYEMLGFDPQGRLDRHAFERQNDALVDLLVRSLLAGGAERSDKRIVEASSRFAAQGARWQPTPSLQQRVQRAALGELKCDRL